MQAVIVNPFAKSSGQDTRSSQFDDENAKVRSEPGKKRTGNCREMPVKKRIYDLALVRHENSHGKLMELLAEIFSEATGGGNEEG